MFEVGGVERWCKWVGMPGRMWLEGAVEETLACGHGLAENFDLGDLEGGEVDGEHLSAVKVGCPGEGESGP